MDRQEMKQKKMMGAILPGNSTVELREFDMPKPGHGQVVVKAMATTICGSDIRCIYREHVGKGPEGYIPEPWQVMNLWSDRRGRRRPEEIQEGRPCYYLSHFRMWCM